ncbi:MAG: ABC transporter permease [Planctomycetaceae bacterium]
MPEYLGAVWKCRYFWLSLVRMDLRTRYRRSVLGLAWSLLQPIAMTVVLCFVFQKLFGIQDWRDYAPSLLAGLCFWNVVSSSTLQGCQCLLQGERYIRQHPAPIAIYPLRVVLGASFHFGVALVVVLALRLALKGSADLSPLAAIFPTLLLVLALGWSLATLAAFANSYFPDTYHLAEVGLQVLFYATPIIYPPDELRKKGVGWFVDYNPLAAYLELLRGPLVVGQWPPQQALLVAGLGTLLALAAAMFLLSRLEKRIIFQL